MGKIAAFAKVLKTERFWKGVNRDNVQIMNFLYIFQKCLTYLVKTSPVENISLISVVEEV